MSYRKSLWSCVSSLFAPTVRSVAFVPYRYAVVNGRFPRPNGEEKTVSAVESAIPVFPPHTLRGVVRVQASKYRVPKVSSPVRSGA